MSFHPRTPYNELPPLFPATDRWKTVAVLEQLNKTSRVLAQLNGQLSAIPNPGIFINTLTLQEAKDSSAIENVFTTADNLFRAYTVETVADPHTKEVLRYGIALTEAHRQMQRGGGAITLDLLVQTYRLIKQETDGIRDMQVAIGNRYKIIYTPPIAGDILHGKLQDWLAAANGNGGEDGGGDAIDPLIKMALLHYQFEAIHPFRDGNGRVGRIINVLYLCAQGLLAEPVLYLSNYINTCKEEYYHNLQAVTAKQEWQPWLLYMLEAVEKTAANMLQKMEQLLALFADIQRRMQTQLPSIYSYEIVEMLFTQVYSKYSHMETQGKVSRNTARRYFAELERIGIVEKNKAGKEVIYKNTGLFELFDD